LHSQKILILELIFLLFRSDIREISISIFIEICLSFMFLGAFKFVPEKKAPLRYITAQNRPKEKNIKEMKKKFLHKKFHALNSTLRTVL